MIAPHKRKAPTDLSCWPQNSSQAASDHLSSSTTEPVPSAAIADVKAACTARSALPLMSSKKCPGKGKKKPTRPSLSEQLASIGKGAEGITKDIQTRFGRDPADNIGDQGEAMCTLPVTNFFVGNLRCRYPAPIHFFSDKCEFQFHHPYESSVILMSMHYRDMTAVVLKGSRFSFNIPRDLVHFKLDYNPSVHSVMVDFLGKGAISEIVGKIPSLRMRK